MRHRARANGEKHACEPLKSNSVGLINVDVLRPKKEPILGLLSARSVHAYTSEGDNQDVGHKELTKDNIFV